MSRAEEVEVFFRDCMLGTTVATALKNDLATTMVFTRFWGVQDMTKQLTDLSIDPRR